MAQSAGGPPYRVAIVGTGSIATRHGRACNEVPLAELWAICDISEDSLSSFGDEFGVTRRYTNLKEMLEAEEIDIAIVSTWGPSHAETTIQLADSGKVKAILCEKPFALTATEAEQMATAAYRNGVLLAEAFKFRHHPMHLHAKELVDSGAIGDVRSIRSTLVTPPRVLRLKVNDGALLPRQELAMEQAKRRGKASTMSGVTAFTMHALFWMRNRSGFSLSRNAAWKSMTQPILFLNLPATTPLKSPSATPLGILNTPRSAEQAE